MKNAADSPRLFESAIMSKKQSSSPASTLASKVLSGAIKPTPAQQKTLAASVLSQDEKKGNGKGGK